MAKLSLADRRKKLQEMQDEINEKEGKTEGVEPSVAKEATSSEFVSPIISEPVEEKGYGQKIVPEMGDIPEQAIANDAINIDGLAEEITPQSADEEIEQMQEQESAVKQSGTSEQGTPTQEKPSSIGVENPQLNKASSSEQEESAAYLAEIALDLYDKLHQLTGVWLKFDFDKMQRKAIRGKFNMAVLNMQLPAGEPDPLTGEQEITTLRQLMLDFNTNADNILIVSEEFKERVRPLLINFLVEKGIGLTSNQSLLMVVVMDIGQKAAMLGQQKMTINGVTKESILALNEMRTPPPPPTEPSAEENTQTQGDAPKVEVVPSQEPNSDTDLDEDIPVSPIEEPEEDASYTEETNTNENDN